MVIEADRWDGPTSDQFAGHECLLGSLEVSSGELVDHSEDPSTELRCCGRISFYEVSYDRSEVGFCFR